MTNTEQTPFLLTDCPEHGTKETADLLSARLYVQAARACERPHEHNDGTDCWVCCPQMVTDPHGYFDH